MSSSQRVARHFRQWGVAGMATAGAGVAAAIIGITGAPAACADEGSAATDPIELLGSAADDLTQAHDVLTQADVPDQLDTFQSIATHFIDTGLDALDKLEAAQTPLLSDDNPFADLANPLFGILDQPLAQDSDAFLTASQDFASDPSIITQFDLLGDQLQLAGDIFNQIIPITVAHSVDQLFDFGDADAFSDITGGEDAGSDAASSIFGDIFSGGDEGADVGGDIFSSIFG